MRRGGEGPAACGGGPSSVRRFLAGFVRWAGRAGRCPAVLENVAREKMFPPKRLLEVAKHYEMFDGVSPINAQNRALLAALIEQLNAKGPPLAVYRGNRNWHPLLDDVVRQMADDGVQRCWHWSPPHSAPIRVAGSTWKISNGPGRRLGRKPRGSISFGCFTIIRALLRRWSRVFRWHWPRCRRSGAGAARVIFAAQASGGDGREVALRTAVGEAGRLVMEQLEKAEGGRRAGGVANCFSESERTAWRGVAGADVADCVRQLHEGGEVEDVVVAPIGFLAENLEIVYDLDVEVGQLCNESGINMVARRL